MYWSVQSSLNRQMTTSIDAEFDLLQQELRSECVHELMTEIQERTKYFHALEYLVVDTDGRRLIGNLPEAPAGDGWTIVTMPPDAQGRDERKFLVRSVALKNGIRLSIGDDLGPSQDIKNAFLDALGWAVATFLALGLTGGLLLSRGFWQRVDAVTQTAEAIMDGKLQSRVPLRGTNDNFDRLSGTLIEMLDRIQVLMESLGQVSNDIAHALRTPLGRLQQKLETASASAEPNSTCERAIDAAVAETAKILDTFSALLRIGVDMDLEIGLTVAIHHDQRWH
jgi:signal transduction histidine kinase